MFDRLPNWKEEIFAAKISGNDIGQIKDESQKQGDRQTDELAAPPKLTGPRAAFGKKLIAPPLLVGVEDVNADQRKPDERGKTCGSDNKFD